jgi:hypothetical protein
MYNLSSIMTTAWALYRDRYGRYCPKLDRGGFQWALREAWRQAKAAARPALDPEAIQARRDAIATQIDRLKYKSFQINTEPAYARLTAELAALQA